MSGLLSVDPCMQMDQGIREGRAERRKRVASNHAWLHEVAADTVHAHVPLILWTWGTMNTASMQETAPGSPFENCLTDLTNLRESRQQGIK